jgi:hypothetical protein
LIGVNPTDPKTDRFITLAGEPKLLRYNSLLPLVVYSLHGVKARQQDLDGGKNCLFSKGEMALLLRRLSQDLF